MNLREELFKNQDLTYRDFQSKLIPNITKEKIIGVRLPMLRKIAKDALKSNAENQLEYYDEIMAEAFLIGLKKCSIEEHKKDISRFVPLIDNWAVCDSACASFKFVKDDLSAYYDSILSYVDGSTYEIRFCIVMLMNYYLTDQYISLAEKVLVSIKSDEYYVNMALAWALSILYIKDSDRGEAILSSNVLPPFVQNKMIQKIRESLRVDKKTKDYLLRYKK